MKVYVVFVKNGGYGDAVIDEIYADKDAAEERVRGLAYIEEREVIEE